MSLAELGGYGWAEAHIIVGRLRSEGTEAVVFDGGTHLAEGAFRLIPVRVMVAADDLAAAKAIIAAA